MNVLLLVAEACTLAVLIAIASAVIALFRQNGRLLLRIEALEAELRNLGTSQNGSDNVHLAPLLPRGAGSRKPAPNFRLPDLTGAFFELSDLLGHDTLLLFWNPDSELCQDMLEDLKALERRPPAGAPKLVLISTGDVETNRAMGLCSLILLDRSSELRRRFAIPDTPSVVLVDAENKIASEAVAGADAVLEVAGYKATVHR